jgi:low temperature requirement protein LtrA
MRPRHPLRHLTGFLRDSGLVRPPSLRTDEERRATRLELFFDLAFVLVVGELADALRADLTPHGVLVFAGLFTAVWWSWVSATLYANRFDHDDLVYRLYKLASMALVVGMAATATGAVGRLSAAFAGCYILLRLLLFSQYARAYRHVVEARGGLRFYLIGTALGAGLWALSLAVPSPARYALWAAGVLVEVLVPLLATTARTDVPLHLEHLPERFSLFVILVLGESVAALALGLHQAHWAVPSVGVAVAAFVLAAALWWSWFDLAGAGAKRLLERTDGDRGSLTRDVYIYGQLPLTLALAAVGAVVQHAVVQAGDDRTAGGIRLVLAGGVALYLAAASLTNVGMTQRWRTGWWAPSVAAVIALAGASLELAPVLVVGALALLLAVVVAVGLVQEARGRLEVAEV